MREMLVFDDWIPVPPREAARSDVFTLDVRGLELHPILFVRVFDDQREPAPESRDKVCRIPT